MRTDTRYLWPMGSSGAGAFAEDLPDEALLELAKFFKEKMNDPAFDNRYWRYRLLPIAREIERRNLKSTEPQLDIWSSK